jgi:enoyl-CoA hydratase
MTATAGVHYELVSGKQPKVASVAVVTLDDGKMNAFTHASIGAFHAALSRATADAAGSVLIRGNRKALSAGFDLKVMGKGSGDDVAELFAAGFELILRIFEFPRPVVMACEGHALALGAIMLLAADLRLGAAGGSPKAKVGMTEVTINMAVPVFAVELARQRMPPAVLPHATLLATLFDHQGAVEAGYLDRLVPLPELHATAMAEAQRLGALRNPGFRATKHFLRRETARVMRETLPSELARVRGKVVHGKYEAKL